MVIPPRSIPQDKKGYVESPQKIIRKDIQTMSRAEWWPKSRTFIIILFIEHYLNIFLFVLSFQFEITLISNTYFCRCCELLNNYM